MDILILILIALLGVITLSAIFFYNSYSKKLNLFLKKNKKKLIAGIAAGSMIGGGLVIFAPPPAVFVNSEYLGFELLDSGTIFHMWTNNDSYYFNRSNGVQFSNHYEEYWTHNVMMLGYYGGGGSWNLIYRVDELSGFIEVKDVVTDDYINVSLYKNLSYGAYDFRLGIKYHLKANDSDLTIIPYVVNLGIEIPFDIGFGWEMKKIQIANTTAGDSFRTKGANYLLNGTLDESYTNLSNPIRDIDGTIIGWNNPQINLEQINSPDPAQYLYLRWNKGLTYRVTVKNRTGQYNAPVSLYINAGTLGVGNTKDTKLHWFDAMDDFITTWELKLPENQGSYGVGVNSTHVFVGDMGDDGIYVYTYAGDYVEFYDSAADGMYNIKGVAAYGEDMYVTDYQTDEVFVFGTDGSYVTKWSTTTGHDNPTGIASNGTHLFVTDILDAEVYIYENDGTYVTSWDTSGYNTYPYGCGTDGKYIWVCDSDEDITRYRMDGSYQNEWDGTIDGITSCSGLGTDPGLDILVSNYNSNEIFVYEGSPIIPASTTVSNSSVDYFVWLGVNGTHLTVAAAIGASFDEQTETIARFGDDGVWEIYNAKPSGGPFNVYTFDIIRIDLDDGAGTLTFDMDRNPDINYKNSRNVSLIFAANSGANFISWTDDASTTLNDIADTHITGTLDDGEYISLWNETTFGWDHFIVGFHEPTVAVHEDDVIFIKVENQEYIEIGGKP